MKKKDSPFVKKEKLYREIQKICSENQQYEELEIIDSLIADFKGQVSSNNLLQVWAMCITILVAVMGFILSNNIFALSISGIVAVLVGLYISLIGFRYLYAEGFVLHLLENYKHNVKINDLETKKNSVTIEKKKHKAKLKK